MRLRRNHELAEGGVCVFITAGPITKLFAGGGGGEWTTCAMIDDEPRPVWMSPLVTHWGRRERGRFYEAVFYEAMK